MNNWLHSIHPRQERLLLTVIAIGFYALYFPVTHYSATVSGSDLTLAIDRATPLKATWIFIYGAVYVAAVLPVFVIKHRVVFRRVVAAFCLVSLISFVCFVVFPIHMHSRPTSIATESFAMWATRFCYFIDQPTGCFPSLHVAFSWLTALSCRKVDRLIGNAAIILALLIGASTMLIKQHYFLDVVAGFSLAALAYGVFIHPVDTTDEAASALHFPRWRAAIPCFVYIAAIASGYGIYSTGWTPWSL